MQPSAQDHVLDFRDVPGQSWPAQADPAGEWYTFELASMMF